MTIAESIDAVCTFVSSSAYTVGKGVKSPAGIEIKGKMDSLVAKLQETGLFPESWTHKVSIGQGRIAAVKWIVFLPPGQKVSDGIYVAFCFGKSGNGLVFGCAISSESRTKYSHINTVERPHPVIDVDGSTKSTHYNDVFVNPLDVFAGQVNESAFCKHIEESVKKCQACLMVEASKGNVMSDAAKNRYELWKQFLNRWPSNKISSLTLSEYTSFGGDKDSFCNWLESRTQDLGSVWGGSAYKFGVFKRNPSKKGINDSQHGSDDQYGWYKRYGDSATEVFSYVVKTFETIIQKVQSGDLAGIDGIDFGHAIKWRIAFFYQKINDPILLPIYKRTMLCCLTDMPQGTPTSVMQKQLMAAKPADEDLFDYYDDLLKKVPTSENGDDDDDDVVVSDEPFDSSAMNKLLTDIAQTGLKYSDELVKRFVAALCAKPFVVLSGLSGSGKTKLAQVFANWLLVPGRDNVKLVPVGADWTNNEHLLGYPNALDNKQYVMPDTGVLKFMLEANTHRNIPYFLILDEMNLSHVERYFADFLSVMESGGDIRLYDGAPRTDNDGISIDEKFPFPQNLYVIGTMNVDETTYMFSPKVLDRAQVIEFRVSKEDMAKFLESPTAPKLEAIKGNGAEYAASFLAKHNSVPVLSEGDTATLGSALSGFFEPLTELGAEFGYRTAFEATKFVSYYCEMGMTIEQAIDAAVLQKLLPKLHGSQARLGPVLDKLALLCKDKYPLSCNKIERMQKRLEVGFTSFAEA